MPTHTRAAEAYKAAQLERHASYREEEPTWAMVAKAYDAGMRHAIENRQNAKRQLKETDQGMPE